MDMPVLIPIPIETKGKSFFVRMWIWLTSIRKWRIGKDWRYKIANGEYIVIPKGFVFDGASVPRVCWGILSPTGLLFIQSLLHDFGYRYDYLWAETINHIFYKYKKNSGKLYWDLMFKKIGKEVNGTSIINYVAYIAVKYGGGHAWRNNRKLKAPNILPEREI